MINVIGDIGMVIAAFLLVRELGTLDYGEVSRPRPQGLGQGSGAAEAVALLLFVGAAAKSAQIPLHTWLPDAMEGPTPVSRPHPRRHDGDGRRLHDRAAPTCSTSSRPTRATWWRSSARRRS